MRRRKRAAAAVDEQEEEEEEEEQQEEVDGSTTRLRPNMQFLQRMVTNVKSGNQHVIDTNTSNAANMSLGATGAASMRLQMQRAASAKVPRPETLRRVVLSAAAQQRLSLCSALLAEVAQGFGFRLTIKQPTGEEVTAQEAMQAGAKLRARISRAAAAGGEAAAADKAGDGGESNTDGVEGAAQADNDVSGDAVMLEPLTVELALAPTAAMASQRAATAKPTSPVGPRPRLSLLTGRLTASAFGSIGVAAKRAGAAGGAGGVNALALAARRRALLRAHTAGAEASAAGAAANAAAMDAADDGADVAGDDAAGEGAGALMPDGAPGQQQQEEQQGGVAGDVAEGPNPDSNMADGAAVPPAGRQHRAKIEWTPNRSNTSTPSASPARSMGPAVAAVAAAAGGQLPAGKRARLGCGSASAPPKGAAGRGGASAPGTVTGDSQMADADAGSEVEPQHSASAELEEVDDAGGAGEQGAGSEGHQGEEEDEVLVQARGSEAHDSAMDAEALPEPVRPKASLAARLGKPAAAGEAPVLAARRVSAPLPAQGGSLNGSPAAGHGPAATGPKRPSSASQRLSGNLFGAAMRELQRKA